MLHGLWLPEITIRQGQDKRHVCSGRYRPEQKMGGRPGGGDPLPAASLEVQPSDSLRGQRIDIFDEQYLVALLIVNEIVHLLFR